MPVVYTDKDISRLLEKAKKEKSSKKKSGHKKVGNFTSDKAINPIFGSSAEIIIAPGLKLKHMQSGLVYDVTAVKAVNGDIVVTATSGDGNEIAITSQDFKNYERS